MSLEKKGQDKKPATVADGLPSLGKGGRTTPTTEKAAPTTPAQTQSKDPLSSFMPGAKPETATAPKSSLDAFMPGAPASGTPSSGRGVASIKNADVQKMQQAILDFADIASSTDVTSMSGNKEGRRTGDQTRAVPMVGGDRLPNMGEGERSEAGGYLSDKQQYELNQPSSKENPSGTGSDKKHLGGSDAFGNFIVSNYIPKDSYIGKQYLNVDVAGRDKRESATLPPSDLRGIIDTVKRVGSPNAKGEKTTDGIWQNRTNNSLNVIADLVQAMLNFTKDMNVTVPGYTEKDLQTFKANVPTSFTDVKSQEDFSKRAQALIPELRKMTEYFRYLNGKVFNNQQLRKYIDQKQSFTKYDNVQIPDDIRARGIPGVQFDWIKDPKSNWIRLHDLSSLDNFKEFLKRVVVLPTTGDSSAVINNPQLVKRYLDLVNQKINEVAATSTRK